MKKPVLLLLLVLALLLVAAAAYAMSSTNFRLNWYEFQAGSGEPRMTSVNFAIDVSASELAAVTSSSTNYAVRMGYWSAFPGSRVFLPMTLRE